eukprot:13725511-Alexandrium_andersonii.AAC.1
MRLDTRSGDVESTRPRDMKLREAWVMKLTAQGRARTAEVQGRESAHEVLGHEAHAVAVLGYEAAQGPRA